MASRGINKVILVGNLGNDPETKYLPSGEAITNISVATSESWKDKQTGQQQERTEWHRCSAFGKLAEIMGQYLRKGSKVYLEGSLHTRKYQDKQTGQDRYSTEIKVRDMQMLDSKGDNQGGYQQPNNPQSTAQQGYQPQQPQGYQQQGNVPPATMGGIQDFDDPIPF